MSTFGIGYFIPQLLCRLVQAVPAEVHRDCAYCAPLRRRARAADRHASLTFNALEVAHRNVHQVR